MQSCLCSSQKEYQECCKPYHEGASPQNALVLMRSRYSAYALGLKDYIIETTHPGSPLFQPDFDEWKKEIIKFSETTDFNQLEILDFTEGEPFSSVTFAAHLTKGKRKASFTEKSYFERIHGRWLYRNGVTSLGIVKDLDGPSPLSLLPLSYYGDNVLLDAAKPVGEITDEIRDLARKMVETMDAADGMGLAAPQVHQGIRLFLVREPREDDELMPAKVFINPEIINPSREIESDYEACLSIPGLEAKVARPTSITIQYTDLDGNRQEERASGLYARALQHEMDHLEGILFFDHLQDDQKQKLYPFLDQFKQRFQKAHL